MRYLRAVSFFLTTLLIYLVPPLLGWGIDDLPGFFSLHPRSGYAALVVVLALATGYQAMDAPEGIRGSKGDKGKRVRRQSIVRVALTLLLFGALVLLPFADRRSLGVMTDHPAIRWPGLALVGFGLTLVYWSGVALGRLYSGEVTVQESHHLITTGPYRHIRHPRYLGAILMAIGYALLFRSWPSFAVMIPLLGALLSRIKDEEAVMHQEFGQEWVTYCKHSWRLIPYLF